MSTIEKLIVQIFERKNSIIEQVRHQVESYDQQLASKLVIQGIDPPSWLWSYEGPSRGADAFDIDKQMLISELLLPLPQHAVPYFNHFNFNSISLPECNFNQQDQQKSLTCFDECHSIPDISTEVGPAASSPQQQVETILDDGKSGLDLSRADFKRSKSRQRALEQRSSAKSGAKRRELDGHNSVVSYRNGTPGMDEFLQDNNIEKLDSAKYSNIQLDDSAKCEGVKACCYVEDKASVGYGNIGISTDNTCSRTELIGAVLSGQVSNPMQSEDPLDVPQEDDAGTAGINIQSFHVNNSSGSMQIKGESVGLCNRNIYDSESSGQINKSTRYSENLGICLEGDAESEGINIRWSKVNNISDEISCGSIVKSTKFQETSNIQFGFIESKCRNTICPTEDNATVAIPSLQLNHGIDSTELDIGCTSKIVGVGLGGHVDESATEEILLAVAHRNCSTDSTMDVHRLSTTGEVPMPSTTSSSVLSSKKLSDLVPSLYDGDKDNEKGSAVSSQDHIRELESLDLMIPQLIGDRHSGMMEVQTEGHSNSYKTLKKLSENPVKTEISLSKNSELVQNVPVVDNDGGISGLLLSCDLSKSREHVLQPVSPAVNIANIKKESDSCASRKNSPKGSGVNPELRSSSYGLVGGNSLLDESSALKTEVQMKSATVEQPKPQKEDVNSKACDHALLNEVVRDQEILHRVGSISCHGTSNAAEYSYRLQDNIGVEENSESEATTSSLGITVGKGESEAMRLSPDAKQATDDSVMIEEGHGSFLEGDPLDMVAKLNKGHCDGETMFLIESALGMESYTGGEENAFMNAKYDGMTEADQSMPVLEGFVMETDDDESFFAGGQIDVEESTSTLRHASVLERLCQSSSRNTPASEFPMTFGLNKTSDLFQSVPTGLLEHISQVGDCSNMKLQQKSYSAGLPVSTDPFTFNVSTPYASPFKKKWERSTSSSGHKSQGSLNPELVCFTIEEDPGNCDEIGNHDEAAEASPSHSSCMKRSLKRKSLTDLTVGGNNPHLSVSINKNNDLEAGQTPKFYFRSQLDSTATEANVTGAQTRARQKFGIKLSNKKRRLDDTKDNMNVSVGANEGKQVTYSLKEIKSQKPTYSENQKAITGVSDNQKVTRSNNIVSNVSSFLPLVQQKKAAAAVVTGKRDVKVKALEVAEAAKRLAEKKENERKAKKEAWKAEKARLEQENLLQLELKKKKKEEELKKKEADIAARKRIREEEEKREKECKRRRIEEARKQQHEQGKKQADKFIRHQADGLRIQEKDPKIGLEGTKMETVGRKGKVTTESKDTATTVSCDAKTMLCDLKESNSLTKPDIRGSNLNSALKEFNARDEKNPKEKTEVLQSYDISPYQGSDDEDEDDEYETNKQNNKFVPSWASKNSLAEAVFSHQHINPDDIFPPGSFCSISTVLIPRKLLGK